MRGVQVRTHHCSVNHIVTDSADCDARCPGNRRRTQTNADERKGVAAAPFWSAAARRRFESGSKLPHSIASARIGGFRFIKSGLTEHYDVRATSARRCDWRKRAGRERLGDGRAPTVTCAVTSDRHLCVY